MRNYIKSGRPLAALILILVSNLSTVSHAKMLTAGTSSSTEFVAAQPTYAPEPEIPSTLLEEGFRSFCVAKFQIKPTGASTVKIDTSSGSPEIDELALETLRRWKFKPAMLDGEPIDGTKKIKVEFKVD